MKVTKRARRDAKQLFACCEVEGRLDEARVRTALTQLIDRKPRGYQGILAHFHRLVRLDLARRSARIESAIPLAPELQTTVAANLARRHGPGLDTAFAHEPALIGGMRIRVGSDVYDGSVRARLAALADEF
jgi:F-type H+-transporting ATPase subunit delta